MTESAGSSPEAVVHEQTNAYNESDTDAFTSCYDETAAITRLADDEILAADHDEIHDRYNELFETLPDLSCEILTEFSVGEFVVCKERVTGMDEPLETLAIYRVEDGRIQQLWLSDE